jgi:hypothetical protein
MRAAGDKQRETIRPEFDRQSPLSLPNSMWGGKRAIDCGDGGISFRIMLIPNGHRWPIFCETCLHSTMLQP